MTLTAAGSQTWIRDTCRQFSDAIGWDLQFVPLAGGHGDEIEAQLRREPSTCWFSEVNDGLERIGFLQLVLPEDARQDRSFNSVGDLAEAFAQLISRSASAARLAESRTDDVATLVDIGRSIPTERNLVDALQRLLDGATQLTAFRSCAFFLLDPSTERLKLRAHAPHDAPPVAESLRSLSENPPDLQALARGRAVFGGDEVSQVAAWLPPGTLTAVCLAVGSEAGPIGTLWVYDRRRRQPTDREMHVLESITVQVATLLERVVLLRESAAQHRLQRDLQLASQAQSLHIAAPLAPGAGIEAAIRSTSRFEIGGDLCELIPVSEGRTALAIGDASGHGISASIVMSAVRGAVHALALDLRTPLAPEEVLVRVNHALHSITPAHQFMSLLYGVIDVRQMLFTYSNAGHPSPVLMRLGGPIQLDSHGMLLGVVPETTYGSSQLAISPGDTLIAFTDGVSEAMNGKRKMFRCDGIIEVLRGHHGQSPQAILEAIWADLVTHLEGDTGHDDASLVVIRVS
ncbi:MAG TPA: SpoIIE family protein phosphatase [Planctomycetaceae bacterium]|jgi:sigma-B regulation protein RsbU (phosphoserine phosphatase)|nr:SpoIIE family protein phosphatase [Planctomycetaceae bacterium]